MVKTWRLPDCESLGCSSCFSGPHKVLRAFEGADCGFPGPGPAGPCRAPDLLPVGLDVRQGWHDWSLLRGRVVLVHPSLACPLPAWGSVVGTPSAQALQDAPGKQRPCGALWARDKLGLLEMGMLKELDKQEQSPSENLETFCPRGPSDLVPGSPGLYVSTQSHVLGFAKALGWRYQAWGNEEAWLSDSARGWVSSAPLGGGPGKSSCQLRKVPARPKPARVNGLRKYLRGVDQSCTAHESWAKCMDSGGHLEGCRHPDGRP